MGYCTLVGRTKKPWVLIIIVKTSLQKKPYFPEDSCALMQTAKVEACSDSHSLPAHAATSLSTDNNVAQVRSENLTLETTRSNSSTDPLPLQVESMECDNNEILKTHFTCRCSVSLLF
ncbi:unnamed protein product [Rhizopus microsporus]